MPHVPHVALNVAPAVPEKVQATQPMQTLLAAAPTVGEYVPATQFPHVAMAVAPTVTENVPALHPMQTVLAAAPTVSE